MIPDARASLPSPKGLGMRAALVDILDSAQLLGMMEQHIAGTMRHGNTCAEGNCVGRGSRSREGE